MNRWILLAAFLTACGGSTDSEGGSGGQAGSAGGGTAGSGAGTAGGSAGGAAGAVGGMAGAFSAGAGGTLNARRCGSGEPCEPDAACSYYGIESGVSCQCDDSGHFFCDASASGGAPPFNSCTESTVCNPGGGSGAAGAASCRQSNGFCTRDCVCGESCTMECNGTGPAEGDPGYLCDETYCDEPYWGEGRCSFEEAGCSYEIICRTQELKVTGDCS